MKFNNAYRIPIIEIEQYLVYDKVCGSLSSFEHFSNSLPKNEKMLILGSGMGFVRR